MRRCRIHNAILFGFISILLMSCVREEMIAPGSQGEPTRITIDTKGTLNDTEPDKRISSLRIMAFSASGLLKDNELYTSDLLTETLTHEILSGSYTFVFIANELSAGYLYESLGAVSRYSDLASLQLPADAFDNDLDIPMLYIKEDVVVLPDETMVIDGSSTTEWRLQLERIAVRFDLRLKSEKDLTASFRGIRFHNLPDYIPLLPDNANYSGSRNTLRDLPLSSFEQTTDATYPWSMQAERIILPSNVFNPKSNADNAILLSIINEEGQISPGTTLGGNEIQNDYTSPRNYRYSVDGLLRQLNMIEVNIAAAHWEDVIIGGNPDDIVLNVSTVHAEISAIHSQRIHFWSNQESVYVESIGYWGEGTLARVDINDYLQGLTGENAYNFSYDPQTGEGYLDLYTTHTESEVNGRIILNAGGMQRDLWCHVETPDIIASDWEDSPYVGTFHRWNQVGERIIYGGNLGEWTAVVEKWTVDGTVIDRGTGSDATCWVVLSSRKSADEMVGTETPGDAEEYPVEGNRTTVSGRDLLYFRVGLTGILADADAAPRYARIKLSWGENYTSYIYVRQGEAPDYIFDTTEQAGGIQRLHAKRIAISNVTVPDASMGQQKVDVGTNGGVFAEYPTQTGYQFPWYKTVCYIPGSVLDPPGMFDTSGNPPSPTWSTQWESCPSGYRRFDANVGKTNGVNQMQDSEVGQSLFLNDPVNFSAGYHENNLWGLYADGLFDRVKRVTDELISPGPNMACRGLLFFHPQKLRSLFMPAIGFRHSGSAESGYAGTNGLYWTKTPNNAISPNRAFAFNINKKSGASFDSQGTENRNLATSIRCIKIE